MPIYKAHKKQTVTRRRCPQQNKCVFSNRRNFRKVCSESLRQKSGLCHRRSPATVNERSPRLVWVFGTSHVATLDDRSRRRHRRNSHRDRRRMVPQLLGWKTNNVLVPQLLDRSFQKARNFTASSHQNAGFSIWVFENFPGVIPPDPHSGRGRSPLAPSTQPGLWPGAGGASAPVLGPKPWSLSNFQPWLRPWPATGRSGKLAVMRQISWRLAIQRFVHQNCNLNSMHCRTNSHRSCYKTSVMCSRRRVPVTRLAEAFCTAWTCHSTLLEVPNSSELQ